MNFLFFNFVQFYWTIFLSFCFLTSKKSLIQCKYTLLVCFWSCNIMPFNLVCLLNVIILISPLFYDLCCLYFLKQIFSMSILKDIYEVCSNFKHFKFICNLLWEILWNSVVISFFPPMDRILSQVTYWVSFSILVGKANLYSKYEYICGLNSVISVLFYWNGF